MLPQHYVSMFGNNASTHPIILINLNFSIIMTAVHSLTKSYTKKIVVRDVSTLKLGNNSVGDVQAPEKVVKV